MHAYIREIHKLSTGSCKGVDEEAATTDLFLPRIGFLLAFFWKKQRRQMLLGPHALLRRLVLAFRYSFAFWYSFDVRAPGVVTATARYTITQKVTSRYTITQRMIPMKMGY